MCSSIFRSLLQCRLFHKFLHQNLEELAADPLPRKMKESVVRHWCWVMEGLVWNGPFGCGSFEPLEGGCCVHLSQVFPRSSTAHAVCLDISGNSAPCWSQAAGGMYMYPSLPIKPSAKLHSWSVPRLSPVHIFCLSFVLSSGHSFQGLLVQGWHVHSPCEGPLGFGLMSGLLQKEPPYWLECMKGKEGRKKRIKGCKKLIQSLCSPGKWLGAVSNTLWAGGSLWYWAPNIITLKRNAHWLCNLPFDYWAWSGAVWCLPLMLFLHFFFFFRNDSSKEMQLMVYWLHDPPTRSHVSFVLVSTAPGPHTHWVISTFQWVQMN